MSGGYLIPTEWALPLAAFQIGCTEDEAQAMIDSGEISLDDLASVERASLKRSLVLRGLLQAPHK